MRSHAEASSWLNNYPAVYNRGVMQRVTFTLDTAQCYHIGPRLRDREAGFPGLKSAVLAQQSLGHIARRLNKNFLPLFRQY